MAALSKANAIPETDLDKVGANCRKGYIVEYCILP